MLYFKMEFLLLLAVVLGVRGHCPAQCRCPSPHVANCASLALMKVPTDRFDRYMQNLDISDNVVVSLDKTSLRDLGVISLVKLNASRNFISEINEEAFMGQSKLQTVDLSSNSIVTIEPKTFIRNPSLEVLSLSCNQNLRLPDEGPFFVSQSLTVLKLSYCNLYYLPPETFQKIPNLKEIDISHNHIKILSSLQTVGGLNLLDVSHNNVTDLQSDIFTALPELIHLNLRHNSLSTLGITVMTQLVNVSSSADLNGNPWVCDCLMFNTIYSWCRDNSVDLDLICSSPPEFKEKPWKIYEHSGCDNDNTSVVDPVGTIANLNHTSTHERVAKYRDQSVPQFSPRREIYTSRNERVAKYKDQLVPHSSSRPEHVQLVRTDKNYFYISIGLFVVFLCFLPVAFFLWWCGVRPRTLRRSGPVQSDAETHPLSISTI